MEVQYKLLSESFEEAVAANREAQSQQVVLLSQNRSLRARYCGFRELELIIVSRKLKGSRRSFCEKNFNLKTDCTISTRVISSHMTRIPIAIPDY